MEKEKISRKEINKTKVINEALKSFITYGIEQSKVNDIAIKAGVTERSAFRYFKSKEDLVLETALLFYQKVVESIKSRTLENIKNISTGIEKIRFIINQYLNLYFTARKELIFVAEAEVYLSRCGKTNLIYNKPPARFEDCVGPFANAIKDGLNDHTVKPDKNMAAKYYNAYDSTLGLIEKMALDEAKLSDEDAKKRLEVFANIIVDGFKN